MTEIDIPIPPNADAAGVIRRIDQSIRSNRLTATMKGTLKSYPGCTHWHCKLGKQPGTLEITYWPAKGRAWFKLQKSRAAPWMDEVIASMKRGLET